MVQLPRFQVKAIRVYRSFFFVMYVIL